NGYGINASGQIVGDYTDASGIQGFLLSGGSFTTLNAPSFVMLHTTSATHINSSAQITGYRNIDPHEGFLYSNGTYTTITAPGGGLTFLEGINDAAQIVGYTYQSGSVPYPSLTLLHSWTAAAPSRACAIRRRFPPADAQATRAEPLRRTSTTPVKSSAITMAPAARFTASSLAAAPTRRSTIRPAQAPPTPPA